jgi:Lon-like ATP-dependent protease
MAPIVVTDEALVEAMIALKKTPAPYVGVFLLADAAVDLTVDKFALSRVEQVHRVGTLAHIQQLEAGPGGAIAMLMAHRRVLIKEAVNVKTPPLIVRVQHLAQASLEAAASDAVKATSNEILATLRDIIKSNPLFQQHVSYFARRIDVSNPYALADFAASLTTADAKELQDVLETMDLGDRLRKALLLLKKEQQLSLLQASIKQDVEKRIDKQQRTWFLMEQLKSITKELGLEKDDKVRSRRRRGGLRTATALR